MFPCFRLLISCFHVSGYSSLETEIAETIKKRYPDYDAFGQLLKFVSEINETIPSLGEDRPKGFCRLSGSITDGSFSGNSRKPTFDIDFTWIVNGKPFDHPTLENVKDQSNYVTFLYQPGDETFDDLKPLVSTEMMSDGKIIKLISPEKFKKEYPSNVDNVLKNALFKKGQKPLFRVLERLLVAFGQVPNVFDTTWYNTMQKIVTLDITPVLQCKGSGFLEAFVKRKRKGNWPSDQLLADIKNHNYYLVPKSIQKEQHSYSWRLSFAPTEEMLFQSMTPFARRTYCLLKLIARNIDILYIRADFLSTYHLKNIFFWALEKDQEKFVEEDIGASIYHLVQRILEYVKDLRLPFYFDPEVNLLGQIAKSDQEAVIENTEHFLTYPRLRPNVPFPFLDSGMVATASYSALLERYPAHVANVFIDSLASFLVYASKSYQCSSKAEHHHISNAFVRRIHDHLSECNQVGEFSSLTEADFEVILKGEPGEPMVVKQIPKAMVESFRDAMAVALSAVTLQDSSVLDKLKSQQSGALESTLSIFQDMVQGAFVRLEKMAQEPAQPFSVAAQSTSITAQSSSVAAQSTSVAAQSTSVAAQPSSVAAQSTSIAAQSSSVAAQSTSVAAQSSSVAAQSTSSSAQTSSIAAQSSSIAAQPSSILPDLFGIIRGAAEKLDKACKQ